MTCQNSHFAIDDGWQVTFWGNNLAGEDYAIFSEWQSNQSGLTRVQDLPRTYGVTVDYEF